MFRKYILTVITYFIIIVVFSLLAGKFLLGVIKQEEEKYSSKLGEYIIIKQDTLRVIDYSAINDKLELSNGTSINYDYYLILKKEQDE